MGGCGCQAEGGGDPQSKQTADDRQVIEETPTHCRGRDAGVVDVCFNLRVAHMAGLQMMSICMAMAHHRRGLCPMSNM